MGILVHHVARAVVGETVMLMATVVAVADRTIVFSCEARGGERLVALGVHQRVILDSPSSAATCPSGSIRRRTGARNG